MLLRGYYTPNQTLACFVVYLQIITLFEKQYICSKQIVQETHGFEISVGKVVFDLWIKQSKYCFHQ